LLRRNLEPIFRQFEVATREAQKARVFVEPEPTPEPGPALGPEIEPSSTFAPSEETDEDEMGDEEPAGLSAPVASDPKNASKANVSTTLGPAIKTKVPGGLTVADRRPEGIIERRPRTQPIRGVVLYATKSMNAKDAILSLANQRRGVHYVIDRDGTIHHLASEGEVVAHAPKGTLLQEATPTDGVTVAVALVNVGHAREGVKPGPLWIRADGALWEMYDWPQLEAAAELVAQILERAQLAPTVAVWPGDKVNPEVTNNPGPAFPTRHFFDLLLRRLKAGPAPKEKPSTGSRVTEDSWAIPLLLLAAFGVTVILDARQASGNPSPPPVEE
jgi:N-acetyl-anhydromuramyl-L-alanine amidase AmpD